MKQLLIMMLAAFAIGAATASLACGACDEDKVAATYDHAIIAAAMARHERVVFVAVDGPVSGEKLAARIAAAAVRMRGVQKGTLRTSASPPAFSFALDAAQKPEAAVARFREAIGDMPARLTLVRVMRNGELIDPR
jgi:chloramphenicol 3-O-phosphotransferase